MMLNKPLFRKRPLFARLIEDNPSRIECDTKQVFRRSSNAPIFRRSMNITDRASYSTEVSFEAIKKSQRGKMAKIGTQSGLPCVISGNQVQYSAECDPQRRVLYKGTKIIGHLVACLIEISSLQGKLLIAAEIMGMINTSITLPLDCKQSAQHYREDANYQDLLQRIIIEKSSHKYSIKIQPTPSNPEVKNIINKKAKVLGFLARNCNFEKQSIPDISQVKVSKKESIRGNKNSVRPKGISECAAIRLKTKEPLREPQIVAQQEADYQPDYENEFQNQGQAEEGSYVQEKSEEIIASVKESAQFSPQEQICEIGESINFES